MFQRCLLNPPGLLDHFPHNCWSHGNLNFLRATPVETRIYQPYWNTGYNPPAPGRGNYNWKKAGVDK